MTGASGEKDGSPAPASPTASPAAAGAISPATSSPPPRGASHPVPSVDIDRLSGQLGRILRYGVSLSALLLAVGGSLVALQASPSDLREPLDLLNLRPWLGMSPGIELLLAGIGVLVGTPIARVGASVLAFEQAREHDYVALVSAVLLVLVASVVVGLLL